jgi:site-specific DNA-adenine methylase
MDIKQILGRKWRTEYYEDLIKPHLPTEIKTYVEPFSGSYAVGERLVADTKVYNDIQVYEGLDRLSVDHIEHLDYKECIKKWDSPDTFFYFDPPYFRKEDWYGGVNNDEEFHKELKETLLTIKGKWIMNYESVHFIEKLYRGFNIYDYNGSSKFIKDITITNGRF